MLTGSLLVILFFVYDLQQHLTLASIKESQFRLTEMYHTQPITTIAAYMCIYIITTALSLPGAVILTLAGGALFGFTTGLIIISFASSIGATLACFAARFILRDWVQNRFSNKLVTINSGIEKEGAFYLFSLRLIPVFPFFIVNLVMGLTSVPLFRFYWVSQVGMLAGTAVFVYAGKELASIDSLGGILSPGVIASFVILGLFPLTVNKIVRWVQKR